MEYTQTYNELKSLFDPASGEIKIGDSEITIVNRGFSSDYISTGIPVNGDISISENNNFTYPVFIPANRESKKVILLLHGLNERSWLKYLVWAYYLSANTGSYVILFPISFHINRSPEAWSDPRAMTGPMRERKMTHSEIQMSSFANIALSNRLTEDPGRFCKSGYQTVCDIVKLMSSVKSGDHGLIPGGSSVNVFAYSIGAFLAQIIFMGNPENLFSDSRLFMFCGGSVFSKMKGTSKLIMDSLAYERVYSYYMSDFEKDIAQKSSMVDFLKSGQVGMAFRSMIDLSRFKSFRESVFRRLKEQTRSIALSGDTVIPAAGIVETMDCNRHGDKGGAEVWDFNYHYTHENPFPLFNNPLSKSVDKCFERLFSEASLFLA